ncbi:MAG TPA: DUF5610 domain-containing protein [Candidatus Hydrogenedentes bacterium]|nr:DUF5610 domain-containing protein [Candidatus Hydrogenedentota bacterium]HIJ73809.1 DUF5610 domain-containing protein [Candidatus Hydrogenedentota bacterium]
MVNGIAAVNVQTTLYAELYTQQWVAPQPADPHPHETDDTVEFGLNEPVTDVQAMNILVERAMQKLYAVVEEARAELGIPEGAALDTSPEATAERIVEFALGAFHGWWDNHEELGEDEARKQFAGFIGGAIEQGIEEARTILNALNALTPEVDDNINRTADIIQDRLSDFVQNGLS